MTSTVYEIDVDPDTVITLKDACTTFAPWIPTTEVYQKNISEIPRQSWFFGAAKEKKKGRTVRRSISGGTIPLVLGTIYPHTSESQPELSSNSHFASSSRNLPTVKPKGVDIRYHVSSRHLMLASPMLKRALQKNGFRESTRTESDGLYHVSASEWDAEAFLIVMRIIHGRNRQIPHAITLELLTKIAVIEDYYQFGEALDIFKEIWLKDLKRTGVPTMYCREVMLWMCAAWHFGAQEQFWEATMVVITQSKEDVDSLGLPIPRRVLGMERAPFNDMGFDR